MIRNVEPADAPQLIEIYNYYVLNTVVTFEEEAVTAKTMEGRIAETLEKYPWLVLEEAGQVLGYAYAGAWRTRGAYKYSVETSVYLQSGLPGRGYGSQLYAALLARLSGLGIHSVIGGVALPNEACLALHQKFGFEKVAHFKEVGRKFDTWVDVSYWEKILAG